LLKVDDMSSREQMLANDDPSSSLYEQEE
jgi:hypothetical protein